jgi:hypothetical protein
MVLLLELTFCTKTLGKMFRFAMWSWARLAGAGRPNSGEPPPGLAREGRGKGARVARGRFGLDLGVEVAGGGVCSGRRRCWPRLPDGRRGSADGEAARCLLSLYGT